ncbi:MAG: flagellar hook-basal body complex protein FliE [Pseudomonadota bacterium]
MKISGLERNPFGPNFRSVRPVEDGAGEKDFLSYLNDQIQAVDQLQHEADAASSGMALGKLGIQETMIAVQKADISFRLLSTVRNKALEAYREIMHMQV